MRILTICIVFIILSSLSVSADSLIKEFSGSGNLTTRPLEVPNGWELQWEAVGEGAMFSVWLRAENGKRLDLLANNMCPTSGSSY